MIIKNTIPELQVSKNLIIVGSSNIVLQQKLGSVIDKFDDVARFNRAPTFNYEDYVGSKTTIRVTNPHVFACVEHAGWDTKGQSQYFVRNLRSQKILVIHRSHNEAQEFQQHSEKLHKSCQAYRFDPLLDRRLSVGILFIIKCIQSKLIPYIYGFGLDEEGTSHYWENKPPNQTSHDYLVERQQLHKLIKEERIRVLK